MRNAARHIARHLACLGFIAFSAAEANAGFTHVNNGAGAPGQEFNHAQILGSAYGGSFNANGVNLTNGSLTAWRLDDDNAVAAVVTDMLVSGTGTGSSSDQCWTNGILSVRAIARFAGYQQKLGIIDGGSGAGDFTELFTVTGDGMNVAGSIAGLDACGKTFRFARGGGGDMYSSLSLDNLDAQDQMVSYRLSGGTGVDRYLLFFEDVSGVDSDRDFNDLVVEITASAPGGHAIPLPPAVWSAFAILITGGLWSSRTRLRRWFS